MDKRAPVVVAKVAADSEASVIKSLLGSYNIPCYYSSGLPNRMYPMSETDTSRIKIFVPADYEEAARNVLKEHRRHQAPLHLVED